MRKITVLILVIIFLLTLSCTTREEVSKKEPGGKSTTEISVAEPDSSTETLKTDDEIDGDLKMAEAEDRSMMLVEESVAGTSSVPSPSVRSSAGRPSQSGLKAGYSDDNKQYNYFLGFLEKYREDVVPLELDVSERIILTVTDNEGKSVPGVTVTVEAERGIVSGLTHADGTYQINPSAFDDNYLNVLIESGEGRSRHSERITIDRDGSRSINYSLPEARRLTEPVPLDIVFVMDTTGSMGEEINRLKDTIRIIHMNLGSLSVAADIRFGMVLYKDRGDEYVTSLIPLTGDIDAFQAELNMVSADGGGDMPEDLEKALDELVNNVDWREGAVRLSYVITDAPAHLDYNRPYSCRDATVDARRMGIKIYGIGTGGLDLQGEYTLRQIAQYTSARYIFLTYGSESGESEGGAPGSVSHHTGANWSADRLESIIIRFTKEELAYLTDEPLSQDEPWFEAGRIDSEAAEQTLARLFDLAVDQLLDFSTWPVSGDTPVAVLPFEYEGNVASVSEYFNEQLILSAGGNERIKLAERKDLGQLLEEINFQNTGLTEEGSVAEIGEFLNAEVLVTGKLFIRGEKYELFLKMIRTETAEVLSVTRAVISKELGL